METFSLDVACIFGTTGIVAIVEATDGSKTTIALDPSGFGTAKLSAPPSKLRFDIQGGHEPGELTRDPAADAKTISITTAFSEEGIELDPKASRVAVLLTWDGRCHGENHPVDHETKKFASWEHIQTAMKVGLDASGEPLLGPFQIESTTPLPIGEGAITFGQIICLAGDFYAHFDDECASRFADAWPDLHGMKNWVFGDYREPTLDGDKTENVLELLETIHRNGGEQAAIVSAFNKVRDLVDQPTRRYLTLASQNYCHFGDDALKLYRRYHALALERAVASRSAANPVEAWLRAIAIEAFGCHFLTDLFATGHMRTPRRALGETFGIVKGGIATSNTMHDEDNELGLWCTTKFAQSPRVVWRAYGDGRLLKDESENHLKQVQEAVRRSVAELYAAWSGDQTAESERGEALIPVPLPPGEAPRADDRLPNGASPPLAPANHFPRFKLENGRIMKRVSDPTKNEYEVMQ